MKIGSCLENEIYNVITKRCVKRRGKIAKNIYENIYLQWHNNSCYIDSLLVSLFNANVNFYKYNLIDYKNDKLKELGIKIRNELHMYYKIINYKIKHSSYITCVNLRKLLNKFYKTVVSINPNINILDVHDNIMTSQLDIFDLYEIFMLIFNFKNELKYLENSNVNKKDFSINIPNDLLLNKTIVKIKNILPKYRLVYNLENNKKFVNKFELLKTPYLFIKIYRNIGLTKINTQIIPAFSIKLSENSHKLYLNSLLIHYGTHKGGHYICLYKSNNKWYEFDDMNNEVKLIGKLSNIINNEKYTKNIVGLVYSKNL